MTSKPAGAGRPFGPLLLAAALAAACSGPPEGEGPGFDWRVEVADLDEAVLSVCGAGDAVFAVGGDGSDALVLEWTGDEWFAPALPAQARVLWWCWVGPDGQAWAVGERGTVLHRSGERWDLVDTAAAVNPNHTLYGIWGAGDRVFVVGGSLSAPSDAVTIATYDGTWTAVATAGLPDQPLFKVWGSAADDVWAVGTSGVILHFDGQSWTTVPSPTSERLIAVWGTDANAVYAVGGDATGLILSWDGTAWAELARTPERLSGLWTAPGRPLYVGGDRGFLARYGRNQDGAVSPGLATETVVQSDWCVHALHGGPDFVVGASSDLFGGGPGRWRGALLSHGERLDGPVVRAPGPDAGPPADAGADAVPPADAGQDAAVLPGPGEACGAAPDFCAPGLECWQLLSSGTFICTRSCETAAECTEYGTGACCARPGFQTLETVCIPGQYAECGQSADRRPNQRGAEAPIAPWPRSTPRQRAAIGGRPRAADATSGAGRRRRASGRPAPSSSRPPPLPPIRR